MLNPMPPSPCGDSDNNTTVRVECVGEKGLLAPTSIAFLPDGNMLIAKRAGGLHLLERYDDQSWSTNVRPIAQLQAYTEYDADTSPFKDRYRWFGLRDVAVDPEFRKNRYIYLSLDICLFVGCAHSVVAKARLTERFELTEFRVIFTVEPSRSQIDLPAGRIAFLPDKTFLLSTGDTWYIDPDYGSDPNESHPQKLSSHRGKILRLSRDGRVPRDNPFGPHNPVYSYGHRDVHGIVVAGDEVWAIEHGPEGGDELNQIVKGGNYGYPRSTLGVMYASSSCPYCQLPGSLPDHAAQGHIPPRHVWGPYDFERRPQQPGRGIAPSGIAINTGDKYPGWKGHIFVGAMQRSNRSLLEAPPAHQDHLGGIWRLRLRDDLIEEREIIRVRREDVGHLNEDRIRDVRLGPDGLIYAIRDEYRDGLNRGQIVRLLLVEP